MYNQHWSSLMIFQQQQQQQRYLIGSLQKYNHNIIIVYQVVELFLFKMDFPSFRQGVYP